MHIQTHIMSGWCLGNYAKLTPRERFCCMLAASWADLDGLGMLAGPEVYWNTTTSSAIIFRSGCFYRRFLRCFRDGGGGPSSFIWDYFISI
jgi:hypothetical protein